VPLGSTATIDAPVAQWRKDIVAESLGTATRQESEGPPARVSGAALRRRLWDSDRSPVTRFRKGLHRPDGTLSLVPLSRCHLGRKAYLLETAPVIHYLSAERDLVRQQDDSIKIGQGLFAMGGPAFDELTLVGRTRKRQGQPPHAPRARAQRLQQPDRHAAVGSRLGSRTSRARCRKFETWPAYGIVRRPAMLEGPWFSWPATQTSVRSNNRRHGIASCI
jgi:hypothetical protein